MTEPVERPFRATPEGDIPLTDEEITQRAIDQAAAAIIPVPAEVTMRQARLALFGAGKLSAVSAAIASLSEPDKSIAGIEWEFSSSVRRHQPLVVSLGPALGLTDAQIDDLFRLAATL